MPSGAHTIDITELVEAMQSTWVRVAGAYAFNTLASMAGFGFVKLPLVRWVITAVVELVLECVAKSALMSAFFLATAQRKAAEAHDYVQAARALDALPPEVSDVDYKKAELAEMEAFSQFVRITT